MTATVSSILFSDVPGILSLSIYINKVALGFSFQAFFPNVIAVSSDNFYLCIDMLLQVL
jgi:hypothetical protein